MYSQELVFIRELLLLKVHLKLSGLKQDLCH